MRLKSVIILIVFVNQLVVFSQHRGKRLHRFEHQKFHFGAMLGTTSTSYNFSLNTTGLLEDSIQQINFLRGPGLAIHLPVVSWNPVYNLNIRTVPSLSFHESKVQYLFQKEGKLENREQSLTPTNLNFPLLIKLNTKRLTNFSAYAITGLCYSLDLSSNQKTEIDINDPILRLKRHDFSYHVGGGFDFFLEYFKFGIDLKISRGINNLLLQDNTWPSKGLTQVKSSTFWISITFES